MAAALSLHARLCFLILVHNCPEPVRGTRSLRLGGAYRLTDEGLALLLRRAPCLEALSLPQCSRLDGTFLAALPASLRQGSLGSSAWLCCISAAESQPWHVSVQLAHTGRWPSYAARHIMHHGCELEQ